MISPTDHTALGPASCPLPAHTCSPPPDGPSQAPPRPRRSWTVPGAARSRALAAVYTSSSGSHPGRPLLVVQARWPCLGLRPLCLECSSFFLYPQHCFLTNSYSSPSSRSDISSMETSPFIPGRKHSFHLKLLIHIWYQYTTETSF